MNIRAAIFGFFILFNVPIYAYTVITHERLSEEALNRSDVVLDQSVLANLGLEESGLL